MKGFKLNCMTAKPVLNLYMIKRYSCLASTVHVDKQVVSICIPMISTLTFFYTYDELN